MEMALQRQTLTLARDESADIGIPVIREVNLLLE